MQHLMAKKIFDAIDSNDIKTIEELIPSNLDIQNSLGFTALMVAVIKGKAAIVEALIKAGVDIHTQDEAGWTALRYATCKKHIAILKLLTEAAGEQEND